MTVDRNYSNRRFKTRNKLSTDRPDDVGGQEEWQRPTHTKEPPDKRFIYKLNCIVYLA